jgi:transposase
VVDEAFRSSEFFDARDLVQVKYEMVRQARVEAEGSSVSAAAGAFGFSRQSSYSAAAALAEGGLAGLVPAKPGPRRAHKLTDEVLAHLAGLREAATRTAARPPRSARPPKKPQPRKPCSRDNRRAPFTTKPRGDPGMQVSRNSTPRIPSSAAIRR